MKKLLPILLCMLLLLTACGSGSKDEVAWTKLSSALELTSALRYYSINTSVTDGNATEDGKIVLSADDLGRTVAYRRDGDAEYWWFNGVTYCSKDKIKQAQSVNAFLDISERVVQWNYDMVSDVSEINGTVTFEVALSNYDKVEIMGKIDGLFLTYISVAATRTDGSVRTISYEYENCGQKPSVSLPSDLSEYVWEV